MHGEECSGKGLLNEQQIVLCTAWCIENIMTIPFAISLCLENCPFVCYDLLLSGMIVKPVISMIVKPVMV